MEISMYLEVKHKARYLEISMYLEVKHKAKYMEISMYLEVKRKARYMYIDHVFCALLGYTEYSLVLCAFETYRFQLC